MNDIALETTQLETLQEEQAEAELRAWIGIVQQLTPRQAVLYMYHAILAAGEDEAALDNAANVCQALRCLLRDRERPNSWHQGTQGSTNA